MQRNQPAATDNLWQLEACSFLVYSILQLWHHIFIHAVGTWNQEIHFGVLAPRIDWTKTGCCFGCWPPPPVVQHSLCRSLKYCDAIDRVVGIAGMCRGDVLERLSLHGLMDWGGPHWNHSLTALFQPRTNHAGKSNCTLSSSPSGHWTRIIVFINTEGGKLQTQLVRTKLGKRNWPNISMLCEEMEFFLKENNLLLIFWGVFFNVF